MFLKLLRGATAVAGVVLVAALLFQFYSQRQGNKKVEEANTMQKAGDAAIQSVGDKFTQLLSDENLAAFPGNREQLKPLAQEVSARFKKGAEHYRTAHQRFQEASDEGVDDAVKKYWAMRGEMLKTMAESKEGYADVCLLVVDDKIADKTALETQIGERLTKVQALNDAWKKLEADSDKFQEANADKFE